MEWLVILSSAAVALLYGYTKLTMPSGGYGEAPSGPLKGGRGLLIGAVWGALMVLWVLDSATPSKTVRNQRSKARRAAIAKVDSLAQEVARDLEAKRETERAVYGTRTETQR